MIFTLSLVGTLLFLVNMGWSLPLTVRSFKTRQESGSKFVVAQ
jgi:hypothetical protein